MQVGYINCWRLMFFKPTTEPNDARGGRATRMTRSP